MAAPGRARGLTVRRTFAAAGPAQTLSSLAAVAGPVGPVGTQTGARVPVGISESPGTVTDLPVSERGSECLRVCFVTRTVTDGDRQRPAASGLSGPAAAPGWADCHSHDHRDGYGCQ